MKTRENYSFLRHCLSILILFLLPAASAFAQPPNNNCDNALVIPIANNGFETGIFFSDTINIATATMQPGETVPPAIFVAGQYQKSIWFRFTIGTSRKVKLTLNQPGIGITSGDVGFSIYKAGSCLPGNSQVSNKLTPLETFGSTFHPCVDSGTYLVQVSSKMNANGPVFLKLEVDPVATPYDERTTAFSFGLMNQARKHVIYDLDCYSKESINETCTGTLPDAAQYTKTSWHTFSTPGYFDYITFLVAAGNTPYFTNSTTQHIIGYKLYEGNAQTTPLSGMTLIDGCDTLKTNGARPGYRTYRCGQLDTGKVYSLQLFFKSDFNASIRVGLFKEGGMPSKGPIAATSWIQPGNTIGNLFYGITTRSDYFACNSRHLTNACGNTKLPAGILKNGTRYNLSTYFTFTQPQASNVTINVTDPVGATFCKNRYVRLFSSGVGSSCTALDTTTLYMAFTNDTLLRCLPAGSYTIQVMGSEDQNMAITKNEVITSTASACMYANFGQQFTMLVESTPVLEGNNYSLYQAGAFNAINGMAPLVSPNTYPAINDTFGCHNAALPSTFSCPPAYKKAMYREFVLTDSLSMSFGNLNTFFTENGQNHYYRYQLFKGDANALVQAQNTWAYPATFTGLTPVTNCIITQGNNRACLVPGTYTFATYGTDQFIGKTDNPNFTAVNFITQHYSQSTVQNMGSILDTVQTTSNNTVNSGADYFSCRDNAVTINGNPPCLNATKAIYREFYLSQASGVQISSGSTSMSLFSGRLSVVGFNGLTAMATCINTYATPSCQTIPAGWYTVVSYGVGASYTDPALGGTLGGVIGLPCNVYITIPICNAPHFNRPYRAAINTTTNAPFLIQWNAAAAAAAYPVTAATFTLPTERWNCSVDTPFSSHPIAGCDPNNTKVAYYVFSLTQVSYLNFTAGPGQMVKLYKRDIRVDSMMFDTLTPIQPCTQTFTPTMEICRAQPGVYTLAIFGSASCTSFSPQIYIDRAEDRSRFDHAANAYDFGNVPATNTFYDGKVGDVNPLNPGRAPSNDFFYCSTGARNTDPANAACGVIYNPAIYNQPDSNNAISLTNATISRRNLWYTFQLDKPGQVKIKVDNKTPNLNNQLPFAVYRSNVDGGLPFTQVVTSGQVDSTVAQGLVHIVNNQPGLACLGSNMVSFTVPPCNFDTQRYYILVDNRAIYNPYNVMKPNHQVEVSVSVDPVPAVFTNHDYYLTASDIGTIGTGPHTGATDNYVCATANPSYPVTMPSCAQRTLWYKFTVANNVMGTAKIRLKINNTVNAFNPDDFLLFRETIPNDSTAAGLSPVHLSDVPNYRQACVSPGVYYLIATGCNRTTEDVFPELLIDQNVGDYCNAPLVATIAGPGSATATTLIDCHTIGTDYGEMSPTISCPANGVTDDYKSSWFRIDITGTDTLDLSLSITENTNASSAQIHYRMMTGNCNAMQEQSCVPDAQTENTYQCLVPGNSYYLQVFTMKNYFNNDPAYPTLGTITLNVNAIAHADTCIPMNNCLVNANYIPTFDCNVNDSVFFNNYSTFGNVIQYLWDFGYSNQTSTTFSPVFRYPSLSTSVTYTVSLRAINTDCNDTSYSVQDITIPARPVVELGNDTATCIAGQTFTLHATSYPGSTYLWQNNTTDSILTANLPGHHTYRVAVNYNGCTARDSVHIYISPLVPQPLDTILICDNQTTVTLDATRNYPGTTYSWSNNATTTTLTAGTPGIYWADITLENCTVRDSFVVQYNVDTLSVLGDDTAICNFAAGYTLNALFPGASAYQWQNNSSLPQFILTSPGIYWVRVTINGCAYTDTIGITSLPLNEFHIYDTVCYGGYHILPPGDTAFSTGIYQDTLAVANGCDSVLNTHLFVRDSISVIAYDTVCSNHFPFVWNGISVTSGGPNAATFISPGINGCDSTTRLHLFVHPTDTTTIHKNVCIYTLPYDFLGTNLSTSGTYNHTLTNAHGCDSFIVLHLNVVTEFRDTAVIPICLGDSVIFYDSVYHNPGFYTHSFVSTSTCDSFKILNLQLNPVTPPPTVVSPVSYCINDAAQPLTATGTGLLWYTTATGGTGNSTAPTPSTGTSGDQVYYVSQTAGSCESLRDSIIVRIRERPVADFTAEPGNIICTADSILVTVTGPQPQGSTQVWNWDNALVNGDAPGPYVVRWNTSGTKTITLRIDNEGCVSDPVMKNIIIKQSPDDPVIELPDYVCVYDTIAVYGNSASSTADFIWSYNGSPINEGTSFNRSWNVPGTNYFSLYLSENGCYSSVAMDSIEVIALPQAKIEGDLSKICQGDSVNLSTVWIDDRTSYQWSPGNYFPGNGSDKGHEVHAVVSIAGWITVNVTNEFGCAHLDSVYVSPQYCCNVFLPNAFSPNGDGRNDVFLIQTEAQQEIVEFVIYNRYGQRIFISHNQATGWDGTQNGNPSDVGTYHFYVKYICSDGNTYSKKGNVQLLR